ncbi:MAG: hypothetical protein QW620_02845 [Thermoplasmata archaeon]
MKDITKLFVPGCYRVLSGRIKCGITVASYAIIEKNNFDEFKIRKGLYNTDETISVGIQYLSLLDTTKDLGVIRKKVNPESVECACALYGGIVWMLDDEILTVWNDLPKGYGLVLFELEKQLYDCAANKEMPKKHQIDLIRHALSKDFHSFSKILTNWRAKSKFHEERKELLEQSLFWGIGEDRRGFSVLPVEPITHSNLEMLEIDMGGLRIVEVAND